MNSIRGKKKSTSGFTLPEIMVASFVFLIFAITLLGTMMMGMRYSRKTSAQIAAQQTCSNIIEAITSELRQAAPNIAPGTTGYLGISPQVGPTAVLYPNANTTSANYIIFSGINYNNWDPSVPSFNKANADNYRQVRYYVSGSTLFREERLISGGSLQTGTPQPLAEARNGSITLRITYQTARQFDVSVTVVEDQGQITESSYTATSRVLIPIE